MIDDTSIVSQPLADAVLAYLGIERAPADRMLLDRLMVAYGQRVPWESASRIVKRQRVAEVADRPRWNSEFWESAMRYGTGGTCFESNRAFLSLLRSLGFVGDLTINNMGETRGCHTAIIVQLGGERLLVDAGYPIYVALPLLPDQPTERVTPWYTYTAHPLGDDEYQIENYPHPKPYLFNLIDRPINDADYCAATTADYGEAGLFLDRVIIRRIVDNQVWRFNSDERPFHIQSFPGGQRVDTPIEGDLATTLSAHFGIDQTLLAEALDAVGVR